MAGDERKETLLRDLRQAQQLSGPLAHLALCDAMEAIVEYQDDRNRIITHNVKLLIEPILNTLAVINDRLRKLER